MPGIDEKLRLGKNSKYEEPTKSLSYGNTTKGLLMSIMAGVLNGVAVSLVRLGEDNGMDAVELLFVRGFFQVILFGTYLLCTTVGLKPPEGQVRRCLVIGIVYCIATLSAFEAVNVIPPGTTMATRASARTILNVALTYFLLKENISFADLIGLVLCFLGIGLIVASGILSNDKNYIVPFGLEGDDSLLIHVYGYSLLFISAICSSIGNVAIRGAKGEINTGTIVFYHSLFLFLLSGILLTTIRQPTTLPNSKGIGFTFGICATCAISSYAVNEALQYAHPALVSFGQKMDVVVSVILQHTLMQFLPKPMELSGTFIIFFGLGGLALYKWLKSRKEQYEQLKE